MVVDTVPKRDPTNVCNARTRDGDHCKHEAGWGTDHMGVGRCKLHGGSSPTYEKTELMQAYRASPTAPSSIRERAQELELDPELSNLRREIAGLRAAAAAINLQLDQRGETRDFAAIKSYYMTANIISKLVEKYEAILRARKHLVPVSVVAEWAEGIKQILKRHITDPELLAAIANDIAALGKRHQDFP